jgi:aminopeptidase N
LNRPCSHLFPPLRIAAFVLLAGLSASPVAAQFQRRSGNPFKPPQAVLQYAPTRTYHVRHLRLIFDIDAVNRSAKGDVTHYLTPFSDNLQAIVLDAGSNLNIQECRIDGVSRPFTHEKEKLTITPATPLARGREVAVEIRYEMPGGIRRGGANGAGGFHWINTSPNDPDRRPAFWTQGETNGNHSWVPCWDYPNDKCTSETIVTVPENWEIVGNGAQGPTGHDEARHTRTFRWTMKQPHSTYLLSLVGGELDIRKGSWAGVPLYYVVPKGKANLIDTSFGDTPDMLQFFSDTFGVKYPWPKYAQSAMYDFGGGMENVSATTLGAFSLTDKRNGEWAMASLNSHELTHQWFGDYVTCAHWGDIWLNESFATFGEMIYTEHSRGKDSFDLDRDGDLQSYLREARSYKRPISTHLYADPDVMFDSHTYPKGALVLHMLRRELGDADFYRGLQYYLKTNACTPVNTYDLAKAFAFGTGHNIEPFLDQWVYKPGHPVLDATWTYDEAGKAVVLKVKQTQDTSDGTPIYTLPLTVGLLHNASSSAVERQHVTLSQADQEFRLPAAVKPDAVLIDPDHDLLKEIGDRHWADSELPTILRCAPSLLDRRDAVRALAKSGSADDSLSDATIRTLAEALKTEPSADVGALLIDTLGKQKKESLRPLFREEAKSKYAARRAAAMQALGALPKTDEDIKLLRAVAMSDTEQYRVVEAAMRALGRLDAADNLDVFRHQIGSKSLRDQLATNALSVLSDAKLDASAPVFADAMQASHPQNVRASAIRSVGTIAPGSAPVHDGLMSVLKEEDKPTLQQMSIRALKDRKDKDAVPTLRALASSAKDPDVKSAARAAADDIEGK